MQQRDYYAILELTPEADAGAIQAAYRAMCKKYHPDTGLPDASAEHMVLINEAYAVLSDTRRRRQYDAEHTRGRARGARTVKWRAGDRELVLAPGLNLPLVRVPAGEFLMGRCAHPGSSDRAQTANGAEPAFYSLTLNEFFVGVYPVTVAQYAAFVEATGRPSSAWARRSDTWDLGVPDEMDTIVRLDRNWRHPFGTRSDVTGKDDHPVMVVSWHDAVAFCRWAREVSGASVRLPTAAEWQKACRGTDGRRFPWGEAPAASAWRCGCRRDGARDVEIDTTPVGAFSPDGDSPYGCADMLGNVWEWTSTATRNRESTVFYGDPYRADDGREAAPSRDFRLLMGGSCQSDGEVLDSSYARDQNPFHARDTGFRVCVDP